MDKSQIVKGQRYALEPDGNLYMFGGRYATVTRVGRKWISIEVERLGLVHYSRVLPQHLSPIRVPVMS